MYGLIKKCSSGLIEIALTGSIGYTVTLMSCETFELRKCVQNFDRTLFEQKQKMNKISVSPRQTRSHKIQRIHLENAELISSMLLIVMTPVLLKV